MNLVSSFFVGEAHTHLLTLIFSYHEIKPKFSPFIVPRSCSVESTEMSESNKEMPSGISAFPCQPCTCLNEIGLMKLKTEARIINLLHLFFYLAGLLFDSTGSYNIVFFLSSGLVIGGSCVMFLIPILLPSKKTLLKVFTPDITVSVQQTLNEDDHYDFVETEKAIVRTSHFSFKSFADQFEIDRSRLLLDRSPNLSSRPSSFVLFSIVPEGSFRDLSQSNYERHSSSREASYTSLARLSEIRVESRTNSCARLEPVAEAETSDSSVSSEFLDVITEPQQAESELVISSLSCDSIDESGSHVKAIGVDSDHGQKDGATVPDITVSMTTEGGFTSEESVVSSCDSKELVSSSADLSENRLSAYSWNSTGSDLSWKTQCSEAGTEDSGYAEEVTPYLAEDNVDFNAHKDSIKTYPSQDNLKSESTKQASFCSCDGEVETKMNNNERNSLGNNVMEHAQMLKEGPLIDPGPSDYYSELLESQLNEQSQCACGEDENDFVSKSVSYAKETNVPFIADLPQPPDIYSEMFEGILEKVNEYVESFSELSNCYDSLKTWPKVSMTDLKTCEQETMV